MPQVVEAFGQRLEFPDGMPKEQIAQAIKTNERKLRIRQLEITQPEEYDPSSPEYKAKYGPVSGMGFGEKLLSGIGSGFASAGRAVGLGGVMSKFGLPADKAEAESVDAPLMESGVAKAGRMIGLVAPAIPTAFIPGANTYAGTALIGGGTGAVLTEGGLEDRAKGALFGTAGGIGGKLLGDTMGAGARMAADRMGAARVSAQAANTQRDAAANLARQSGFVIPPADVRGGFLNEALGGLSGKIKTAQVASARNQLVTNDMARRALGIADDVPLSAETLQNLRATMASTGYAPIRQAGEITADAAYSKALDSIASQYQGAARSFSKAAPNPVKEMVDGLREAKFDAGDALDMVKVLRENADKAFRTGDSGLGKASKSAASALEDQIERHLKASGDDAAMAAFRKARQDIAKSYTVQKALNSTTGDISAPALARELAKGRPLSGELKTIAEVANAFGPAMQSLKQSPKALSPLDFMFGGGGTLMTGSPMAMAGLAARPAARSLLLSKPYQAAFATPQSYAPSLLESQFLPALQNDMLRRTMPGVGGLLSANAAQ